MIVAIVAAETVVLVLLSVLVAGLLRSHGAILRRLHALGAGFETVPGVPSPALQPATANGRLHDVSGTGLRDDAVQIAVVGTAHRTLLAFLSSGCSTCRAFWDAFASSGLGLPADVRVVIVAKDAAEESTSALRELAPGSIPVLLSSAAWAAYDVPGSPYFVLADGPNGRVRGEGTGTSWPQVRDLMLQAGSDGADATEGRIDRELLEHGIAPGDPSLYRTAEEIDAEARA